MNLIIFIIASIFMQWNPSDSTIRKIQLQPIDVVYVVNSNSPVTFSALKQDKLVSVHIPDVANVIQKLPNITYTSDSGLPYGYTYFRLRGINQTRINVTLDGIPLNEPEDQGIYFSNYVDILANSSDIQIQRGIGYTKNGNASYAGSMDIQTVVNRNKEFNISTGVGSYNTRRTYVDYNTGISNGFNFYTRLASTYTDGYKYNSFNRSKSIFSKISHSGKNSNTDFVVLVGNQKNSQAWLGVSEELLQNDRRTNANLNELDDFTQSLSYIKNSNLIGNKTLLESAVFFSTLNGNYDFDLNNYLEIPERGDIYNYALASKSVGVYSNITYNPNSTISNVFGIFGNLYNRNHIGSEQLMGKLYENDGTKNEVSTFNRTTYSINNLKLSADVQLRHVTFKYNGDAHLDRINWLFVNPKFGAIYSNNGYSLYYNVGFTNREPTRTDMFSGSTNLEINQPVDFSKESVVNSEIGFRYSFDKLNFRINLYNMNFENEYTLNGQFGPNGLPLTRSVESSNRKGVEIESTYSTDYIDLSVSASANDSKIVEAGTSFSPILSPKYIANISFMYKNPKYSIGVINHYQDKSFINFENSEQIPSFIVTNLLFEYNISHRISSSVSINNLFNEQYYTSGYVDYKPKYFTAASRNAFLNLTVKL